MQHQVMEIFQTFIYARLFRMNRNNTFIRLSFCCTFIKSYYCIKYNGTSSIIVNVEGAEGFVTEEDQELLNRIEKQIKRRFVIGSQVSEHAIIQDFVKQVMGENFSLCFLVICLLRFNIFAKVFYAIL